MIVMSGVLCLHFLSLNCLNLSLVEWKSVLSRLEAFSSVCLVVNLHSSISVSFYALKSDIYSEARGVGVSSSSLSLIEIMQSLSASNSVTD